MKFKLYLAATCMVVGQICTAESASGAIPPRRRIDGLDWEEQTLVNLMVDNATTPGDRSNHSNSSPTSMW